MRSIDDYFTVLTSLGIQVKPRVSAKTGEVDGYSLAAPGDTVFFGGSKLAPDLSYNRLLERLPTQEVADRPQPVTADPAEPWRRTESAARSALASLDSGDDAIAQGHLDVFADTLHNLARATPGPHQAELQAAAQAFNRARRSAIQAHRQAATELQQAARELTHAANIPGGLAVALIFTALHLARAAAKWHEQRGHEQQAAAAEEAFRHLQESYRQTAEPFLADLAQRAPRPQTVQSFEATVRQAVPDHADRILADTAWPALATTLARAESAGHNARLLLAEVAANRELDTAERLAEVLNWRITAQPNKRAQAARAQSTRSPSTPHVTTETPTAYTPLLSRSQRSR